MRSQTLRFLRAIAYDIVNVVLTTLVFALIGALCVGVFYLLGWGVAAVYAAVAATGPTTVEDRVGSIMALMLVAIAAYFCYGGYIILRALKEWLHRRWTVAKYDRG